VLNKNSSSCDLISMCEGGVRGVAFFITIENSFKPEAAIFPMHAMLPGDFPFSQICYNKEEEEEGITCKVLWIPQLSGGYPQR